MKRDFSSQLTLLGLCISLGGCAGKPSEPQQAGNQSGTDATGTFACAIDRYENVALDQRIESKACSANEVYAALEGNHDFSCTNGRSFVLEVVRGSSARLAIGHVEGEAGDAPGPCELLELDVSATASAVIAGGGAGAGGAGDEAQATKLVVRFPRDGFLSLKGQSFSVSANFNLDSPSVWLLTASFDQGGPVSCSGVEEGDATSVGGGGVGGAAGAGDAGGVGGDAAGQP